MREGERRRVRVADIFFEACGPFCAHHTSSAFCLPLRCRRRRRRCRLRRCLLYCFIVSLGIWQFACWFFMTIMYVNFSVPRSVSLSLSLSLPLSLSLTATLSRSVPEANFNSTLPQGPRMNMFVNLRVCVVDLYVRVCERICAWAPLARIWLTRFLNTFGHFHTSPVELGPPHSKKKTEKKTLRTAIFSFYLFLSLPLCLSLVCVLRHFAVIFFYALHKCFSLLILKRWQVLRVTIKPKTRLVGWDDYDDDVTSESGCSWVVRPWNLDFFPVFAPIRQEG